MKHVVPALFILALTACTTAGQLAGPIHTPALPPTPDNVQPVAPDTPTFAATDLANAHAIFEDRFRVTGNLYDKAGMQCVEAITLHLPELQALSTVPAPPKLAAPVTGVFSGIAAVQVTVEATQADIAARLALLREGIPPDVHIACAYLRVKPRALFSGIQGLAKGKP